MEQDEPAQGDLPKPPSARVRRVSGRDRRPAAAKDVEQIREAIADLRRPAAASPAPVYRYLTVEGIEGDARTQARLRAKILVAHRLAARGRPLAFLPEPGRLTLGIAGDDAAQRISRLHEDLRRIANRRRWTITEHPTEA